MGFESPEEIVQRQVDAYNSRDVERFVSFYSPEIEIVELPSGRIAAKGAGELDALYSSLMRRSPGLNCRIVNRMVVGMFVVDEEKVTGFSPGGEMHALAIYQIEGGFIRRVWMIRESG